MNLLRPKRNREYEDSISKIERNSHAHLSLLKKKLTAFHDSQKMRFIRSRLEIVSSLEQFDRHFRIDVEFWQLINVL